MITDQVDQKDYLTGGHAACPGCGAALGLKLALKALNGNAIVVNASGCMTLLGVYPTTPFMVPWIHCAIENAGAVATGIQRALRRKGKDTNVLVYAGDGATYDIGLQALSGAIERGEDIVYICYNNEAFGNTGMQRSSATPQGARTTTTPQGKEEKRKNMPYIIASHGCYVATACVSYPFDLIRKVKRAAEIKGPGFIDLLTPCVPGWGYESSKTIALGRLAVESGYWDLFEIVEGEKKITVKPPNPKDLSDFYKVQKRFSR